MPIVVEGVRLEKYLVWINEGLEEPDSIEEGITRGGNISTLGSILLICKGIANKIRSYKDKFLCYWMRLTKIYKLPLTQKLIFYSIKGLIIIYYPSILSVLYLDWLVDYLTYAYRIIFGDVVMCADIPGSQEPLDTKYANEFTPYPKEEIKEDVERVGRVLINCNKIVGGVAVAKATADILSGDIPAVTTDLLIAGGSVLVDTFIEMGVDEVKKKIENMPDNHPPDEPASPSVYGNDPYNAEIPFLRDLLEYIQGLDNNIQLMCFILIFIMIAIFIQTIKVYKNKINNRINQLPYNNKYFNNWKKYKNIMNKYGNRYFNIIIGYYLLLAFLGILLLIYLV